MLGSIVRRLALVAFAFLALPLGGCQTESVVTRTCDAAEVLRQFSLDGHPVPSAELSTAKGLAIIKETEGGLIVGGRGGKGVLIRRTADGKWSAPLAVDSGGLSVGLQAGVQGSGVVMSRSTRRSTPATSRRTRRKVPSARGAAACATRAAA
jgi:lipid-binding SYLF domain-containing protein